MKQACVDEAVLQTSGSASFPFPDWPCKALLTEDNGQIASPGWPAQYPRLLDCTWTIQAPTSAKVFLQFSAIDLDGPGFGRCTEHYDYLEVRGPFSYLSPSLSLSLAHGRQLMKRQLCKKRLHVQRFHLYEMQKFCFLNGGRDEMTRRYRQIR